MTSDTGLLNETELETVSGGITSLIGNSTIVLPHIPRDKDLLTRSRSRSCFRSTAASIPRSLTADYRNRRELNCLSSPPLTKGGEVFSRPASRHGRLG